MDLYLMWCKNHHTVMVHSFFKPNYTVLHVVSHNFSVALKPILLLCQCRDIISSAASRPVVCLELSVKITCVITLVASLSEWRFSWESKSTNNLTEWDRRWCLQNKSIELEIKNIGCDMLVWYWSFVIICQSVFIHALYDEESSWNS